MLSLEVPGYRTETQAGGAVHAQDRPPVLSDQLQRMRDRYQFQQSLQDQPSCDGFWPLISNHAGGSPTQLQTEGRRIDFTWTNPQQRQPLYRRRWVTSISPRTQRQDQALDLRGGISAHEPCPRGASLFLDELTDRPGLGTRCFIGSCILLDYARRDSMAGGVGHFRYARNPAAQRPSARWKPS